jgi:hypothetical protein
MRKSKHRILRGVPVLLVLPQPLLAGFPLSTEDTGTRGSGRGKVEVVVERGEEQEAGEREVASLAEFAFAYGLRENVDFFFAQPYRWVRVEQVGGDGTQQEGIGDTQFGVKWRYYEHGDLSMGLKAKLTLPRGDDTKKLGQGESTQALNIFATLSAAPWEYHYDLGYKHNRNVHGQREGLWHLSAGGERNFGGRWKLVADIGLDTNKSKSTNERLAFSTLGFSWALKENVKLEGGVKLGLTSPETDITWLIGMSQRF